MEYLVSLRSSTVEQAFHKGEDTGSNPVAGIKSDFDHPLVQLPPHKSQKTKPPLKLAVVLFLHLRGRELNPLLELMGLQGKTVPYPPAH